MWVDFLLSDDVAAAIRGQRRLKIKIEIDTDPPPGFSTETRFLLQPIPFSVRVYDPPSLFSGKMHALLRRTELDLTHLEVRKRQSGHYSEAAALDEPAFRAILATRTSKLNVANARSDVERFLLDPSAVSVWSREFFSAVAEKIVVRE